LEDYLLRGVLIVSGGKLFDSDPPFTAYLAGYNLIVLEPVLHGLAAYIKDLGPVSYRVGA